jgi:hypothetical protein
VQLDLEVVDIALGGDQLILSVLQSGAGVVDVVDLEVMAVISPHQLIVQLLDARLKAGVLLKKLSVALLNVPGGAVLSHHLAGVLLQAEAQVSTHRRDLLKQGAHMLGVACYKRPTRMVGRKLDLPPSLAGVHDTFHVSQLKKCFRAPMDVVLPEVTPLEANLSYPEHPIKVLD